MHILYVTPADDLQAVCDQAPEGAVVNLSAGIYRQKVLLQTKGLTLVGAGQDETILIWDDHARKPHAIGYEYNTFRTYTLAICADGVTLSMVVLGPAQSLWFRVSYSNTDWLGSLPSYPGEMKNQGSAQVCTGPAELFPCVFRPHFLPSSSPHRVQTRSLVLFRDLISKDSPSIKRAYFYLLVCLKFSRIEGTLMRPNFSH